MAKVKTVYSCSACGAQAPKWSGQCAECGAWNTLSESIEMPKSGHAASRLRGFGPPSVANSIQALMEVAPDDIQRLTTGMAELDRVLGGGVVPGSVILLGGDPGIGKSTLVLQTIANLSAQHKTLYVTGEESLQQVSLRSHRLGLSAAQIRLLAATQLESVLALAVQEQPQIMVIDSIQTMVTELLQSAPGSVAQVRECAAQWVRYAKQTNTVMVLIGHVTKEGVLAGPRILEHMVDTVLYFEGEAGQRYRMIRAVKNRYGAVNELGVFAMTDHGLREVANPSAIFLSQHPQAVAGSVIMVTLEGNRPLLVEVQALVDNSYSNNPRRVTVGFEYNRLAMLLAVLHRHGGITSYDQDVFANIVGGIRVTETGADLPVLLAVVSSLKNRPIPVDCVVFGEIGLAGEIRPVPNGQERLNEARKQGYKRAVVATANAPRKALEGMEVVAVRTVEEALSKI